MAFTEGMIKVALGRNADRGTREGKNQRLEREQKPRLRWPLGGGVHCCGVDVTCRVA